MEIRDIGALTRPDPRVPHFTGLGLSVNGVLAPEDSARFIQEIVASHDLVAAVPDATRSSFERLRTTHVYGFFCYELFTVADDLSMLVVELALAERFIAYYSGNIPFMLTGQEVPLVTTSFNAVYDALRRGGTHSKGDWRLRSLVTGTAMPFKPTLTGLFEWARHERLLPGQRTRRIDGALVAYRNMVAHPRDYHLGSPIDSSRGIGQMAEIINRLWGANTAGGRLFPAPFERDILAISWKAGEFSTGLAQGLVVDEQSASRTFLLVRGAYYDEWLMDFDTDFETTLFPTEWLWGPGRADEAVRWLADNQPQPDKVEYLDRWFVVREHQARVDPPRRLGIFAGLPEGDQRLGTWHLIRADSPVDAWTHIQSGINGDEGCAAVGLCNHCAVEVVGSGTWSEVVAMAAGHHLAIDHEPVTGIKVPEIGLFSHWR